MRHHTDHMVQDLADLTLFASCRRSELSAIARLCTPVTVGEGFVLTAQGGPGMECFVIGQGTAEVSVDGRTIATVGPGDCVGEMALLDGGRRRATVTARTPMTVYVLTRAELRALIDGHADVGRTIVATMDERKHLAPVA